MYSPFNSPDDETTARVADLVYRMRCFDTNMRARANGYHKIGADLFGPPVVDPHGNPWTLLLDSELEQRKQWCMQPEQHVALQTELARRAGVRTMTIPDDTPAGTPVARGRIG
jgi:hypothetical protein